MHVTSIMFVWIVYLTELIVLMKHLK